jgi:hypothetical protein
LGKLYLLEKSVEDENTKEFNHELMESQKKKNSVVSDYMHFGVTSITLLVLLFLLLNSPPFRSMSFCLFYGLDSAYERNMQYLSFSVWFILLNTMTTCSIFAFFFLDEQYWVSN